MNVSNNTKTYGNENMKNGALSLDAVSAFIAKFIGLLLVITAPIHSVLIASTTLLLVDLVTGVWAAIKEKKKIRSSGIRRTITKFFLYNLAIIVAFVLEKYLLDGLPVVNVIGGLVGLTEGKSIFENIYRITGINFWAEVVSKLNMNDSKANQDQEPK